MDDLKKSLRDKASRLEKEGTPLRGLLASSRLFIEETYKTTVATFSPVKAQNLYAERVNLASKSFNAFKHNNQRIVDYCRLYPSTVIGAAVAAVAIPSMFVCRFRTAVFASAGVAALSWGAIDLLSMDISCSLGTNKKSDDSSE